MPQLSFGVKQQIKFANKEEFFEALGFLSRNLGVTSIHWEKNELSGAWGSEGRIHCYKNLNSFPSYFSSAFTKGVGNILNRINCNDYVKYLVDNYCIDLGHIQDEPKVRSCVPQQYLSDYLRGLSIV